MTFTGSSNATARHLTDRQGRKGFTGPENAADMSIHVLYPGHPARRRGVRRGPPRQPGAEAVDPGDTRRPLATRTAQASPRQDLRGKAYFSADHMTWHCGRRLVPRIARPDIESDK